MTVFEFHRRDIFRHINYITVYYTGEATRSDLAGVKGMTTNNCFFSRKLILIKWSKNPVSLYWCLVVAVTKFTRKATVCVASRFMHWEVLTVCVWFVVFCRQLQQQQQAELEVHQRDGLTAYDLSQVMDLLLKVVFPCCLLRLKINKTITRCYDNDECKWSRVRTLRRSWLGPASRGSRLCF